MTNGGQMGRGALLMRAAHPGVGRAALQERNHEQSRYRQVQQHAEQRNQADIGARQRAAFDIQRSTNTVNGKNIKIPLRVPDCRCAAGSR